MWDIEKMYIKGCKAGLVFSIPNGLKKICHFFKYLYKWVAF